MDRACGILMHISSLPSDYGIGTFGEAAYSFVDFLKSAGQKYWQTLPLNMTSYGDSPYQSPSAFAGNINFIDFDMLRRKGYLQQEDYLYLDFGNNIEKIDYSKIFSNRSIVLQKAVARFNTEDADYRRFCNNHFWLDDYALFMAIKEKHNHQSFTCWDDDLKFRKPSVIKNFIKENKELLEFYKITQYFFYSQFSELKDYAFLKGILIIGDIPFYIAYDSADVWSNPELFELDSQLLPLNVAGVPPDFFSTSGQLWGNPLYDYDQMKKDNYNWFKRRFENSFLKCDILRIDHFRAFDSYYAIPFGSVDACIGEWRKGVGLEFLEETELIGKNIIAEDLGDVGESVQQLIKESGFPNMKVLEFAFDRGQKNEFLPHNYDNNCVVYTGTHDNNTVRGWYKNIAPVEKKMLHDYMPRSRYMKKSKALIEMALESVADTAIIPMQDYLDLGEDARMNMPSTLGGNWEWRVKKEQLSDKLARRIRKLTLRTKRIDFC